MSRSEGSPRHIARLSLKSSMAVLMPLPYSGSAPTRKDQLMSRLGYNFVLFLPFKREPQ